MIAGGATCASSSSRFAGRWLARSAVSAASASAGVGVGRVIAGHYCVTIDPLHTRVAEVFGASVSRAAMGAMGPGRTSRSKRQLLAPQSQAGNGSVVALLVEAFGKIGPCGGVWDETQQHEPREQRE